MGLRSCAGWELVWCGSWQTTQVMATFRSFVSAMGFCPPIKASRTEPEWQRPQLLMLVVDELMD